MKIYNPTLLERVIKMNEKELLELAEGEAIAIAVSSKFEGLTLENERIRAHLLEGFRSIRNRK